MNTIVYQDTLSKMKMLSIVSMIFIHCVLFYSLFNDFQLLPQLDFKLQFGLTLSLFSLCIPGLAGAELRLRLDRFIINDKVRSISLGKIIHLFLFLTLLESVKSWIASGFEYTFRWDVLPLISISSIFIILFIKKIDLNSLYLIMPLFFLLEPFLNSIFKPLTLISENEVVKFYKSSSFQFVLITYLIIFISSFNQLVKMTFKIEKHSYLLMILKWALFLTFGLLFTYYWNHSAMFSAAIWNLPFASFVELGEVGGHIWPIFPWAGLVMSGFLFQDLLKKQIKIVKLFLLCDLIALFAFIIFLYFSFFRFRDFYNLLSPVNYFSSNIFKGGSWLALFVISFYICFHYLTYRLSQFWQTDRNLLFRFVNSGILIIYVIHFILAARLSPVLAQLFHGKFGFFNFFILITITTLLISALIIYLYQSRITITFKKVNK